MEDKTETESKKDKSIKHSKDKKVLTPTQRKRKTWISSGVVAIIFGVVGSFAGLKVFSTLNPKTTEIKLAVGADIDSSFISGIQKSITNDTVLTDYQSSPENVLNYACYMQAMSPYSLLIAHSGATAAGVTQNIESATYSTPTGSFNQNISSSSFVHTAYRFYDDNSGTIKAYRNKYASDWTDASISPDELTYNSYIGSYGKLFKGYYYCVTDSASTSAIKDEYLTSSATDYEASKDTTKHSVQGVIVYSVYSSTILDSTFVKNDDGTYKATFNLNVASGGANEYYKVQMKSTGGLKEYPTFTSSKITFNFSSDLYLISSYYEDSYKTTLNALISNVDTSQQMTQYYYHSDTSTITNGDTSVDVAIPEISNTEFNGFDLWKD